MTYQQLIDLIYSDHVHFSIKSLSRPYNHINRLPKQQIEEMVQVIKMAAPDFFHSTVDGNGNTIYGDDVLNGKFYSLKATITYLAQQKLSDEEKALLNHLFYYYNLFSKMEHPGRLTFMLVHKSFDPRLQERSLIDVLEALQAVSRYFMNT